MGASHLGFGNSHMVGRTALCRISTRRNRGANPCQRNSKAREAHRQTQEGQLLMATSLKVSAVDLGTNTLKATHATRLGSGELVDMEHASDTIRLGFGIEKTGRIENHRIDECMRFLKEQEEIGREYGSRAFI